MASAASDSRHLSHSSSQSCYSVQLHAVTASCTVKRSVSTTVFRCQPPGSLRLTRGLAKATKPSRLIRKANAAMSNTTTARGRTNGIPIGYDRRATILHCVPNATSTSWSLTALTATVDQIVGVAGAAQLYLLLRSPDSWMRWLLAIAGVLTCTRALRGLECLVHEGSHHNWSRRTGFNDRLCNLLAAFPVFTRVQPYREKHIVHHREFASPDDPDRKRYDSLSIELMDVRHRLGHQILQKSFHSTVSWFQAAGSDWRTASCSVGLHSCIVSAGCGLFGVRAAIGTWLCWIAIFVGPLSIVRFLGEAEEHDYLNTTTEFEATISNVGLIDRLLIHPHGDGYHLAHHLWQRVPHHRLRSFDRTACQIDPTGFGAAKRQRRFRRPI